MSNTDIDGYSFSIKVNDRGGVPYRDYTPTTFRKLFLESKTGANFELMSLIEGMTYLGYFVYCNLTKQPEKYDQILKNHIKGSFNAIIGYLYKEGIIDEELRDQLYEYKKKRNEVMHNWLPLKNPINPKLKDYSHDEALGDLYKCGMKTLTLLNKVITPNKETWTEYVKKFTGLYKRIEA